MTHPRRRRDPRALGLLPGITRWVIEAPVGTIRYWICLTVLVSRLAATRHDRLKLSLFGLTAPMRDRLPWRGRKRTVRVRIAAGGRRLWWHLGPKSDLEVMNEILVLGVYDNLPISKPRVILDLGSHIGVSILRFRLDYPDARIIGIEPDPSTFSRLKRNAGQLGGIELHELAVVPADGNVSFYPATQSWVSTLESVGSDSPGVMVRGRSLDSLLGDLDLSSVDLVKIDIEGAELEVLRPSRRLGDVRAIVGEFHDRGDPAVRADFFALFDDFDQIEIVGDLGHPTHFTAVKRSGSDPS